jgi:hypothetical protein
MPEIKMILGVAHRNPSTQFQKIQYQFFNAEIVETWMNESLLRRIAKK